MNTRALACQIIARVLEKNISLDEALDDLQVKQNETAFIKEICYGVIRWYYQLRYLANQFLTKSLLPKNLDVLILLCIGFYQILFMRVPDHAAVNETVNACRTLKKPWAASLINGILRNLMRNKNEYLAKIEQQVEALYAHPSWLIEKIKNAYPTDWQKILTENNQRAPMCLRVNLAKISRENYFSELQQKGIHAQIHPKVATAILLENPVEVTELPGFQEGYCSVQDAAAQLSGELLELTAQVSVLDACAAPGGKTAHILETELLIKKMIALDIDAHRLQRVKENLERLGFYPKANVTLMATDAIEVSTWWDGNYFDCILIDAPCSGTGVIRRHPDIKILRKKSDIAKLANKQYSLLKTLWPLLKVGGILVYATCSILPEENDDVIERFLQDVSDAKMQRFNLDVGTKQTYGWQILPGDMMMDGFYYCKLEKIS